MIGDWPLPKDKEGKIKLLMRLIEWIPDTSYRIMIRKHGLTYAGIIEDMNVPHFDSQYTRNLPWLTGWRSNGGRFGFNIKEYSEPRKRKVPDTGELEDTIIDMNDIFILSSRNTDDLSDEDKNFTADIPENEMRQHKQLVHELDLQRVSNGDMLDKLKEQRMLLIKATQTADTYGREIKRIQETSSRLILENAELSEQVNNLLRTNKILRSGSVQDESKLYMVEQNAGKIGTMQGMTPMQLMEESAQTYRGFMQTLSEVIASGGSQDSYKELKAKLDEVTEGNKELVEKIENLPKPEKTKEKTDG